MVSGCLVKLLLSFISRASLDRPQLRIATVAIPREECGSREL